MDLRLDERHYIWLSAQHVPDWGLHQSLLVEVEIEAIAKSAQINRDEGVWYLELAWLI